MPHTILIVDDSEDVRIRYKDVFKNSGFATLEAKNGEEGLNMALEKIPSLILTGISMPKMDGFELIKRLRNDVKAAKIPIIICSHYGRQEDKIKAQELGIKDFIVTGFTPPIDTVKRARLLIEGEGIKQYFLDVNEVALDAAKLTKDFDLPPYFQCKKHVGEKMSLVLSANPENPKEFKARFVCPKDLS